MKLINVKSATTAPVSGMTDFVLTVTDADDGTGDQFDIPFTLGPGDTEDMATQVNAWLTANPGFTVGAYVSPTPTGADVDAERDRRRYLQISVTTSPTGTFPIDMDAISQLNIQGVATAGLYLANAAPSQVTVFRDANNVNHNLLPSELIAMGLGVQTYIGNLYAKSWALKAMSPIPADYAADSYWV